MKKLFALILALVLLCSCVAEETPEPVLTEEPVVSVPETEIPEGNDYVVEKEEATMEQMEKFVDMLNDEDGLDGLDLDLDLKDLDLEDGLDDLISDLD